jgi:hypothetical protein
MFTGDRTFSDSTEEDVAVLLVSPAVGIPFRRTAANAFLQKQHMFVFHAFPSQEMGSHAGEIEETHIFSKLPKSLGKELHSPKSERILHLPGVAASPNGRAQKSPAPFRRERRKPFAYQPPSRRRNALQGSAKTHVKKEHPGMRLGREEDYGTAIGKAQHSPPGGIFEKDSVPLGRVFSRRKKNFFAVHLPRNEKRLPLKVFRKSSIRFFGGSAFPPGTLPRSVEGKLEKFSEFLKSQRKVVDLRRLLGKIPEKGHLVPFHGSGKPPSEAICPSK